MLPSLSKVNNGIHIYQFWAFTPRFPDVVVDSDLNKKTELEKKKKVRIGGFAYSYSPQSTDDVRRSG